jgi:hypothetical protein
MSDTSLPATGKDVTVQILLNAVPVKVLEITSFSEETQQDEVETKPLGTSERYIDHNPTGYSGSFEVSRSRKDLDEAMDLIRASSAARVPSDVSLIRTVKYRDGSTGKYLYRKVKLTMSTDTSRGEAVSTSVTWTSGVERLAL